MRLLKLEDTDTLAEQANNAIAEAAFETISDTSIEMSRAEGADVEYAYAHDTDLWIVICEPRTDIGAVQAVDQTGLLDPSVIAVGQGPHGPVTLLVMDHDRVRHDPALKRTLEDNAAGLISSLGVGLFALRAYRGGRVSVLNPRYDDQGRVIDVSGVDRRLVEAVTDNERCWRGTTPERDYYARPAGSHLIEKVSV